MTSAITVNPFAVFHRPLAFVRGLRWFLVAFFVTIAIACAAHADPVSDLEHLERLEQDVIDGKSAAKAFDELISKLQSADELTRGNAAAILGKLPFLLKRLGSEENKATLAKLDTKRAGEALARLIDDPDQGTQVAVLGALRAYPTAARENLERLCALLFRDDERVAHVAADTIGHLGSEAGSAAPKLVKCFQETSDETLQQACAYALAEIGPSAKEAIGPLGHYLKDSNSNARIYAAKAIGQIDRNDKRAPDALLDEAETTQEDHIRDLSVAFLEDLAKESRYAFGVLQKGASSKNAKVRKNSLESLGRVVEARKSSVSEKP